MLNWVSWWSSVMAQLQRAVLHWLTEGCPPLGWHAKVFWCNFPFRHQKGNFSELEILKFLQRKTVFYFSLSMQWQSQGSCCKVTYHPTKGWQWQTNSFILGPHTHIFRVLHIGPCHLHSKIWSRGSHLESRAQQAEAVGSPPVWGQLELHSVFLYSLGYRLKPYLKKLI